ncbi:MAG: glycosyltransferase family 2 protein [Motilibacteraceae bacterium]
MPVLNEERHLRDAVARVLGQDYPGPLEVVLALGPSRDRTDQIARTLAEHDSRVTAVPNPSGRTPAGLNAAIHASRHPIVVRVDGHGMLPPGYVRTAVELLARTGAANVGGMMAAEGETPFERAVACAMTSPVGVGGAAFHTGGQEGPADTVYLGVFRRSMLEELGGYDESFVRAQDWELNYRIRSHGGLVWFSPELQVSYRPRRSLSALARQYFHYGRWRRVVMRRHRGSWTPRYLAPPVTLVVVATGTAVGATVWRPALLAPAGYAAGVVAGAAWSARGRQLPRRALAVLPVVLATMHFSWAAGFLTSHRSLGGVEPETVGEAEAGGLDPAGLDPAADGGRGRG